jgi:small subunit ribosomal protein S1
MSKDKNNQLNETDLLDENPIVFNEESYKENENVSLENFDWDLFESGLDENIRKENQQLGKLYDESISNLNESEVFKGKVVRINEKEVIVDINFKSEGVIFLNEFRYNTNLKVGDEVEVMVDKREDKSGQLLLSHKKARTLKSWDKINELCKSGEIISGVVKARTKGGMIVDILGLEAFLPGSQIDVKPIKDYDQFVGLEMDFKVVKVNHEFKNVVVSHKALIEADIEIQKKEIIGQLEKGQVLEGVVKNITSYGVFVDLGGVDGLIHITDISWSRINHPSEVVEVDQKIKVVILDFDDEKTRIQLGIKQLEAHPWDALSETLSIGDKIKGKVVVIADYGAFIEITPGVEGLIHVSEMSWSTHLSSAQDFVKVGNEIEAVIITLDRESRKMSLGLKQLTPDPWIDIMTKYPMHSTHTGIVRNFTNFGLFLELEDGVDGLLHISDLSWTKKIKHPSEFCSVGDKIEVKVLELDTESRRLSLGHKQLESNPWDEFSDKYAEGTAHEGIITSIFDKGASVEFEDKEVDAFVPIRLVEKEDGSKVEKNNKLQFKVIEFNKELKRVVVSHTATYKEQEAKEISKSIEKQKSEKSTLGDISELVALKKSMEPESAKSAKKSKKIQEEEE